MTLNWGHKLTLGFVLFAGMILYLVFQSMQTRYDLVSKEYYKDELQYQQVIDGTNRANSLSSRATVTQSGNNIIISLPNEMQQTTVLGNALFYCADNALKDKKVPLQVNAGAEQTIDSREFVPGNYTVKLSWESNGKQYYTEVFVIIS